MTVSKCTQRVRGLSSHRRIRIPITNKAKNTMISKSRKRAKLKDCMTRPQCGHFEAVFETLPKQSGQLARCFDLCCCKSLSMFSFKMGESTT